MLYIYTITHIYTYIHVRIRVELCYARTDGAVRTIVPYYISSNNICSLLTMRRSTEKALETDLIVSFCNKARNQYH